MCCVYCATSVSCSSGGAIIKVNSNGGATSVSRWWRNMFTRQPCVLRNLGSKGKTGNNTCWPRCNQITFILPYFQGFSVRRVEMNKESSSVYVTLGFAGIALVAAMVVGVVVLKRRNGRHPHHQVLLCHKLWCHDLCPWSSTILVPKLLPPFLAFSATFCQTLKGRMKCRIYPMKGSIYNLKRRDLNNIKNRLYNFKK